MIRTPWGRSDRLKERRLPPGPGTQREEVARNQRERLFGAMVASVAEKGYEATTVADLVRISGVSSRTFYDLFADKSACFVAAIEAMLEIGASFAVDSIGSGGSWDERAERAMDLFAEMVVAQPAAARMCLIDVYAAGPEAEAVIERAIEPFEALTAAMRQESDVQRGIPVEMVSAFTWGMQEIVRTRLYRHAEDELPELLREVHKLTLAYRAPPEALHRPRSVSPTGPELLQGHNHSQRAVRAFASVVADRGYLATTVADVVKRAGMSTTTFYTHFRGKSDVLIAAIESGAGQVVAAVEFAAGRNPDWTHSIGDAFRSLFSYLAAEPAFAYLLGVEVYVAGAKALECRAQAIEPLARLLDEGYERSPNAPPVTTEAIMAAVYALVQRHLRREGPASLPALAPLCTYVALSPFVSPEEACEVANWRGGLAQQDRVKSPR
jgi:AcrR family transcriptional regulator